MKLSYRSLGLITFCGLLVTGLAAEMPVRHDGRAERASLRYTVSITSPESRRVAVTVSLAGLELGKTAVCWGMRRRFAFVRLPEPLIDGPICATVGGRPATIRRAGPYEWEATAAGQGEITLSYVIPLRHRTLDAVKDRDAYEYPYLAADHGMLVTPTLFVYPKDVAPEDIRVRFDLPPGWQVITPWRAMGTREFAPDGLESLLNDLIGVGAWQTHEIRVGAFVGTVAIAPGQDSLEKTAVDPIRRIVEYELELFDRPAEGRYLFVFGRPDTRGMAGSPKTHSMTLSVEPGLAEHASKYLPHLIAHEFFHTWTAALFEMPDELRWVGEGFTDYYAHLVPARLGLSTWDELAATLAEKMQSCAINPQRGQLALSAAGKDVFFNDRDAYNLVYDGGLLIAAWLDRAIRGQGRGKTLDDLMRAFNNDPRWTQDDANLSLNHFLDVAERFTDRSTAATLERFVTQPYEFDPLPAFAQSGVRIRREIAAPKMDLRANLDGTRVIDVDASSIAYRVGVRADDRLVKINGQPIHNALDVRAAWRKPVDNRIRVTLERDGRELKLDEPVPRIEEFIVPTDPWREHG